MYHQIYNKHIKQTLKQLKKLLFIAVFSLVIVSCSTKQDKFLNRSYHAVTAQYNPMFHGFEALEAGKEDLVVHYYDDFWNILPVERVSLIDFDEREIGYESEQTLFERAEEKAVIAVQKHSMPIDGKERNFNKMAQAYLLLGQARYYDSRFIPAIDAFNFILSRYPLSKSINDAIIWRSKTFVRLDNEELAIQNLKQILKRSKKLKPRIEADATSMIAQAYIQMDSLKEALPYIHQAAKKVRNKELKGRYYFIEGQLHDKLNNKKAANIAYEEVVKLHRRTLRNYYIQAQLNILANTEIETEEERVKHEKTFDRISKNRENRPFLDHIYHRMGEYYQQEDSIALAKSYYNKSIAAYNDDETLQAKNYYTLAEINFDNALYLEAGAYYDSTLTFMKSNTIEHRRVEKKLENLSDVIKYETLVSYTDSILNIVNMSEADQLAYFTKYTRALEEKHIADSIAQALREARISAYQSNNKLKSEDLDLMKSNFYFYNASQAARGRVHFEDIWGKRRLEDNWRLSKKQSFSFIDADVEVGSQVSVIEKSDKYNPQTYIDALPKSQVVIDSLILERDLAYYQLGLIYKEKFREYNLAEDRLIRLLEVKPEERLVAPAKYHLYKIYEAQDNNTAMINMRNRILNTYPESRYAQIILDPEAFAADAESLPETKYKETYVLYEKGLYEEALEDVNKYLNQYIGDEIESKFELLKAVLIGRIYGYDAYKEALSYVVLNYPNQLEAKQAEKIYSEDLPNLAFTEFEADETSTRWKLIYRISKNLNLEAEKLVDDLIVHFSELNMSHLKISIDYYNISEQFVVVHGLHSKEAVEQLQVQLIEGREDSDLEPVNKKGFAISSPNYEKVLIHKNVEDYLKE